MRACSSGGATSRSSRCSVQSPPRSTFDGTSGNGTIEPTSLPSPLNSNDVTYRSTPSWYAASVVVRTSEIVPFSPTKPPHAAAGSDREQRAGDACGDHTQRQPGASNQSP